MHRLLSNKSMLKSCQQVELRKITHRKRKTLFLEKGLERSERGKRMSKRTMRRRRMMSIVGWVGSSGVSLPTTPILQQNARIAESSVIRPKIVRTKLTGNHVFFAVKTLTTRSHAMPKPASSATKLAMKLETATRRTSSNVDYVVWMATKISDVSRFGIPYLLKIHTYGISWDASSAGRLAI